MRLTNIWMACAAVTNILTGGQASETTVTRKPIACDQLLPRQQWDGTVSSMSNGGAVVSNVTCDWFSSGTLPDDSYSEASQYYVWLNSTGMTVSGTQQYSIKVEGLPDGEQSCILLASLYAPGQPTSPSLTYNGSLSADSHQMMLSSTNNGPWGNETVRMNLKAQPYLTTASLRTTIASTQPTTTYPFNSSTPAQEERAVQGLAFIFTIFPVAALVAIVFSVANRHHDDKPRAAESSADECRCYCKGGWMKEFLRRSQSSTTDPATGTAPLLTT